MNPISLEHANAVVKELVYRQWRDWTGYLDAQLTLLAARMAEGQVAFERDATHEAEARQAQARLDALPPASRTLFAQIHEEQRQAAQAAQEAQADANQLPDLDAIERRVLEHLRRRAHGEDDATGVGVVPLREGATVNWYHVQVDHLTAAPTAATYALGGGDGASMRTRAILATLLVVGGLLFLAAWFLWPRGGARTATGDPVIVANGTALAPWPVRQVVVGPRADRPPATLPVQRAPATPADATPGAIWHPADLVPLRLCLPADILAEAATLTLVSGDGRPDRVYALGPATDRPDLVLEPCGGRAAPRTATFQRLAHPADAAIGRAHPLPDGTTATVTAITLTGPGDDPTLPTGQARLTVVVQAPISDWAAVAPTLLLADGQPRLPAETLPIDAEQTALGYLVPLTAAPTELVWSLTPPGSVHPTRWRASVPAPPDRATVVRGALATTAVVPALRDGTLTLTITVGNQRAVPFTLQPQDLALTRGAGAEALPLTAPSPAIFTTPLAPNTTRTLLLTAPLRGPLPDALVLTVGAQRFRIAPDP